MLAGCNKKKEEDQQQQQEQTDEPVIDEPEQQDEEITEPVFLQQQLEEGAISADEYVSYSIFGSLDKSVLPEEYQQQSLSLDYQSAIEYAGEHFDELSTQTKDALASLLTLSNLEFDDGSSSTSCLNDFISSNFESISATSSFIQEKAKINCVKVTENEHFIIWYTDQGNSAIDEEKLQAVAEQLEECVSYYNQLFNCRFHYEPEALTGDNYLDVQHNMLKKNGYDSDLLENALSVYIFDYSDDGVAGCYNYANSLMRKISAYMTLEKRGLYLFPYLVIDSDSELSDIQKTAAHELFHHYQNQILPDKGQLMGDAGVLGQEATAVWASNLVISDADQNADETMANTVYLQHIDDIFATIETKLPTWYAGYAISSFVFNYQNNVDDSLNKIVDGIYTDDFIQYLHNQATIQERTTVMKELAYHSYAQDYSKGSFNGLTYKRKVTVNALPTSVSNKDISRMAVHYYTLGSQEMTGQKLTVQSGENQVQALLIYKNNIGSCTPLCCTGEENTTLDLAEYASQDGEFILAVYNTSFVDSSSYSFVFEKSESEQTAEADSSKPASYTITNASCTILDDEYVQVQISAIEVKSGILNVHYSAVNKTGSEVTIEPEDFYINLYHTDYISGSCTLQPNSSEEGVFYGRSFDFSAFKPEEIGSMEFSFTIEAKDGSFESYTSSLYTLSLSGSNTSIMDAYNNHLETAHYSYNKEECVDYSYTNVLSYQQNVYSDERLSVNSVMVLQDPNGTQTVIMEIENRSSEMSLGTDFSISAINNVQALIYASSRCQIHPNHRQIITFKVDGYTYQEREKEYGFNAIGSYEISADIFDDEHAICTISFGDESIISSTPLFENNRCALTLTGAVADDLSTTEKINLNFRIDLSDEQYAKNGWDSIRFDDIYDSIQVDGQIVDTYSNSLTCRNRSSALVEIELKKVDATVAHTITGQVSICGEKVDFSIQYQPNVIED